MQCCQIIIISIPLLEVADGAGEVPHHASVVHGWQFAVRYGVRVCVPVWQGVFAL